MMEERRFGQFEKLSPSQCDLDWLMPSQFERQG